MSISKELTEARMSSSTLTSSGSITEKEAEKLVADAFVKAAEDLFDKLGKAWNPPKGEDPETWWYFVGQQVLPLYLEGRAGKINLKITVQESP